MFYLCWGNLFFAVLLGFSVSRWTGQNIIGIAVGVAWFVASAYIIESL